MCVYRNFFFFSNNGKIIVVMRIIVELSLCIVITVNNIGLANNFIREEDVNMHSANFFIVLILLKSFVIIIGGIIHSGSYKVFYENIIPLYNRFKNEPSLKKFEKRMKIKFLIGSLVFAILSILLSVMRINDWYYLDTHFFIEIIIYVLHEVVVDIRYMLEHIVVYSAITSMYEYLKCLNNSVHKVLKKYYGTGTNQVCVDEERFEVSETVDFWMEVYQYIMICSKHISMCFNELVGIYFIVLSTHMYKI